MLPDDYMLEVALSAASATGEVSIGDLRRAFPLLAWQTFAVPLRALLAARHVRRTVDVRTVRLHEHHRGMLRAIDKWDGLANVIMFDFRPRRRVSSPEWVKVRDRVLRDYAPAFAGLADYDRGIGREEVDREISRRRRKRTR